LCFEFLFCFRNLLINSLSASLLVLHLLAVEPEITAGVA